MISMSKSDSFYASVQQGKALFRETPSNKYFSNPSSECVEKKFVFGVGQPSYFRARFIGVLCLFVLSPVVIASSNLPESIFWCYLIAFWA